MRLTLIGSFTSIWVLMYMASSTAYDMNYFFAGLAMLISLVMTIVSVAAIIIRTEIERLTKTLVALFCLSSSPISILCFIFLFQDMTESQFLRN